MVFDRSEAQTPRDFEARVFSLGSDDVPQMLALVDIARPGPFALRTIELGSYVGIRHAATRRLVAIGGERFRLSSHLELSAIAVHPDARGGRLGAAVTAHLANAALARGLVPFLHVFPDNPAVELYKRLGFRERTRLWVLWRRPLADGTE
jgi:predicted GNAT family acetyltransferase